MADTASTSTASTSTASTSTASTSSRTNILNSDGQPHRLINVLAVITLVLGLVSFVLGLIVRNVHTGAAVIVIATTTGLIACLVGLYDQMISATREQRIVIVTGIIAGFVGLAIGLSKGGFVP